MSLRSPLSPRQQGFAPLANQPSSSDMQDIPLRQIRSNASSTTGARRADMEPISEKNVLFAEAVGTPAGRRRIKKDLKRTGSSSLSEETSLNAMGRFYNKIVSFSVVTRYLVYIVPVALLLAIPLLIIPFTGNSSLEMGGESALWFFIWLEVAWLSIWVAKLVAHVLPFIFMFFCGVISSGTRKYATVLRALEIPLSLFLWGLASWLTFKFMLADKGNPVQWTDTVQRILLSLFLASAVLLGEKAIVQLISISYHQRSFANRIKDSKREIYLLGLMYEASRALFPMYCAEFSDEDYIINDSIDVILTGGKPSGKGVAAAPMKLVGEVGRFGDKLTSVFGNIASEITGKQVFNPNSAHSIVVEALEKVRSSEAMARRIWMSFVVEGKDSLSMDDITEVMGPAHREEAEECFSAIDADENGDISLDEMIRKVVEIGKERKAIANSMKDISQALTVFDKVLLFVVLIIVIIIFLAVFQSSFIATLTTAGTTLLSLSFVFAVTTQEFLGSCIFLFVKHPYDVGDRVDIQGPEKQQLTVEKISLLYTVFTRIDKMQVVQVPNIALNNLWIENVTRSKAMKEVIDVNVSFDTSFEDIELLRLEMEEFVRSPENSRDFQPDIGIGVGGVGDLDKLTLKVAIKHKSNWHNDTVRATRRSKFMCALTLALKKVPIYAPGGGGEALGGPKNPTYSVAVTDEYAITARSQADKDKEAKRMDYIDPEKEAEIVSEQKAAQQLNTTNPVVDALDDWGYEETLGGRDPSTARPSTAGGAGSRTDLLNTRESQRGRRRAGDTAPLALGDSNTPGVQLTRAPTTSTRGGRSFDVERQAGVDAASGSPYSTWTAYNSQTGQQAGPPQPQAAYSPPQQSANLSVQAPPRPGQSPSGARPRGASVSSRAQAPTGDGGPFSGGQFGGGPPPPPGAPGPSSARY
ncbi:Mechanosensitive ion channel-domain-containing protein [Triangularia verruculosa]|uniref:Mechanosensitive ion channel-domain-containing protein n=1 Tax=Triangularia verruculosa TaxID=2587418 RepID=A0AAN6X6S9_9PEZI|nr:Mechanosensitive ion channel-domain-containing protein [Triangularia verruculosa]